MTNCELCGKEGNLAVAFVEGVRFRVCPNCAKYGKVVQEWIVNNTQNKQIRKDEFIDIVDDDYSKLIREIREKKGLSQHDLANKINEKESLMAKVESGALRPDLKLAKKLEQFLNIKLITTEKMIEAPTLKVKNGSLTIGDFIKR